MIPFPSRIPLFNRTNRTGCTCIRSIFDSAKGIRQKVSSSSSLCTQTNRSQTSQQLTAFFGDAKAYNDVRPSVHPAALNNLGKLLLTEIHNDQKKRLGPCYDSDSSESLRRNIHIVELGSGTGLLTNCLLPILQQVALSSDANIYLTCLEPVDAMRDLHAKQLEVQLPLYDRIAVQLSPNSCADLQTLLFEIKTNRDCNNDNNQCVRAEFLTVDAILSAQAFHWIAPDFNNIEAIAKTLDKGGLLWNAWNTRLYRPEAFYQQYHCQHCLEFDSSTESNMRNKHDNNDQVIFSKVEEWIDEAYKNHPIAPVPRQTNFQWKDSIDGTNYFTQIESNNTLYNQQMTFTEYYKMLVSISVVKDAGMKSLYNKDSLKLFLDDLIQKNQNEEFINDENNDNSLNSGLMNIPYLCETHWCWRR